MVLLPFDFDFKMLFCSTYTTGYFIIAACHNERNME